MTAPVLLRIDAAMRGNRVIYWLGRIPLIRRLVSDTLYSADEGKLALSIVLWLFRALKAVLWNALCVFCLCVLPLLAVRYPEDILPPLEAFGTFCWLVFVFFFLGGAALSPCAVTPSQLKYTCVRMMGMDARRCVLGDLAIRQTGRALSMLAVLLAACGLFRQGIGAALLLTLELVCARLVFEALHLLACAGRRRPLAGQVWFMLTVGALALAGGLVPPFLWDAAAPWLLTWPAAVIALLAAGGSLVALLRFPRWYRLTLDTCAPEKIFAGAAKKSDAQFKDVKLQDSDLTAEGDCANLSGWPYLQALFFRRHRRMMYKPLRIVLIIEAAVTVLGCAALLILCPGREAAAMFDHVTLVLPFCVFFLYVVQNNVLGSRITRAMFHNCDLAMLKFGWYRQPGAVLKNFLLRFRRLCGVNLLLSAATAAMLTLLTLCAGGRPPLGQYLLFAAALLCLGVFFAVHSLGMYYLFQPYTADLKAKNPFFNIINMVMYVLCYACIQIRSTPSWFTPLVVAVTVVYSALVLTLVRVRAPRTFRVK